MGNKKILIVEDEIILAMELKMILQSKNLDNTRIVKNGEQAIESAKDYQPDVILMDIMLPGAINGIEAAKQIIDFKKTPIIYITGNDHLYDDKQLLATNPIAVLGKPVANYKLFESLEKAFNKKK